MDNQNFLKLLNFTDLENNSLLMLATLKNDVETVKALLEEGANVNHHNFERKNILTIANEFNDRTLIDTIFPKYLTQFDDKTKNTLLGQVNQQNIHLLALYQLSPNEAKENPLWEAIKQSDLTLLEKLLKQGIDPNKATKNNPNAAYSLVNKKIDFITKALTLFDKYGLDKNTQNENKELLSYVLLNNKPSQTLLNYLEKNNYPIQLSKKASYGNNIDFVDLTYFKLNEGQINKYIIDTVNQNNYMHINYSTVETLHKNDNPVVFQIAQKIIDNNWATQIKFKVEKEYQPQYFDLFETLLELRYNKGYFRGENMPTYFLSTYPEEILMNESQQRFESKVFTQVKNKTEFNFKKYSYQESMLEDLLSHYSLEDFQIKSSHIDFSRSNKLNNVFSHLVGRYHNVSESELNHFEKLLKSDIFDINYEEISKEGKKVHKEESFLINYLSVLTNKYDSDYDWKKIDEIEDSLKDWMPIILSKPINLHLTNKKGESALELFKKVHKSIKLNTKTKNLLTISLEKWKLEESIKSEEDVKDSKKLKI